MPKYKLKQPKPSTESLERLILEKLDRAQGKELDKQLIDDLLTNAGLSNQEARALMKSLEENGKIETV